MSAPAKLEAMLFDIDGTLADTDEIHWEVFRKIFAEHRSDVELTMDLYIKEVSGKQNGILAKTLFPHYPYEKAFKILSDKEAVFREVAASKLVPMPGLIETLEFAKKNGIKIAAVTNAPKANADMMLKTIKVDKYFELVVLGGECENPKPSPEPYLKAMEILGIDSGAKCLIFEDSIPGMQAAVAAGGVSIGILTTQTAESMKETGAHFSIPDYTRLILDDSILKLENFIKPSDDDSDAKDEIKEN